MTTTRYPVPAAVFEQHSAWLATSGAGKTTAVKGSVERMLVAGERVVIIDPTGVWWGLRFQRDGRGASPHKVVIFGREHADLPLEAGSGEAVARALGTSSTSAILSLKGMRVGERARFITDFFETLVATNRGILNLVVDEIHLFAPQSGGTGLTPAMLHATNNLVSTGRAAGLRIAMISQRPAKVHKDSLTQAKSLVALQCSHPLDQRPIRDWLSTTVPDKASGQAIMTSLAGLPTGSGWMSAPQLGLLERVEFPLIATFDSSRPGVEEIPLKPLDVAALREAMAAAGAAVDKSAESNPLKARRNGAQIDDRAASADELAAAEARGYERGVKAAAAHVRHLSLAWRAPAGQRSVVLENADSHPVGEIFADAILEMIGEHDGPLASQPEIVPARVPRRAPPLAGAGLNGASPRADDAPSFAKSNGPAPTGSGKLGAERRILAVLAGAHPAAMTEAQWAVAAGMKRTGGTWGTYKSRLRVAGAIEQRGSLWFASARGLADVGSVAERMPAPGAELVEFWISRISGVGPMLRELARRYPHAVERDSLAASIDMTARGGTFGTYLSRLSSAGLVEKTSAGVRAAPALMERP